MAERIIFLDLDGPMIPGRAYTMPGQTKPIVKAFDQCAVGMLNEVCKFRNYKIVLHTSWIRIFGGKNTYDHCIAQGIEEKYFHADAWCDEHENWRYTRVAKWLEEHPDVTDYYILDDEPYAADIHSQHPHPENLKDRLLLVDFRDGLLSKQMEVLYDNDIRPLIESLGSVVIDGGSG